MQHYHFGDKLTDETKLDGMPSFEVYQRRLTDRGYDKFELGKLIRLDVSDYSKINYEQLIAEIKNAL